MKAFVEFFWKNGVISFFKIPGVSITINDESKFIYSVCCMMDGENSLTILKEKISLIYPKECLYLENLLSVLDNEYLIEDLFYNRSDASINDQMRWSKNIEFLGSYCKANENKHLKQKSLSEIKVTILGLGGVGSNILLNLAALGVLNFRIVDYDVVNLSNLNRQILYNETEIGHFKCDVAKSKIQNFSPNANIEHFNKKLDCEKDVAEVISGQDFVFAAADIPRDKILDWVNSSCVKYKIPYICGGLDSLWATYFSIIPGLTGCMECWKYLAGKERILYRDIVNTEDFFQASSPNVAIMPMISMVSGLVANEFLKIVTDISEPKALGKLCVFNFKTTEITIKESWYRLLDCPVCSV